MSEDCQSMTHDSVLAMQHSQQVIGHSWINNQALQLALNLLLATDCNTGLQLQNVESSGKWKFFGNYLKVMSR